ncbi:MAG: hypothetical protein UV40_C0045G0003 [Parcubacteria group bacterium GW2011_GWA1_42_7]|nr:MAG: hypothetical protein UV40_C0045G0003 [Parcubacteria group bacterium GW2011_GWA1_42_7]
MIEKIKEGDTQAIRELKEQRGQLKEQRLKIQQDFIDEKQEIINKIQSGDQKAARELQQLNQERKAQINKIQTRSGVGNNIQSKPALTPKPGIQTTPAPAAN